VANNLATLSSKLATAIRDTDHAVWNSTEKDDLITWAVAGLWPRIARALDPESSTITIVADDYFYSAPTGILDVEQLEWRSDSVELGFLEDNQWTVTGDEFAGNLKIRVAPGIVDQGGTLRVHGYGRYDTTTNLIPDDYVPIVISRAREEALRRVAGDRARFKQWMVANQKQGVTVNELLQQIDEAERHAIRLEARYRTQRRPRPGRRG
jgi:hypothetical protein